MATVDHDSCVYTPTGGARVPSEALQAIRSELVSGAEALGYPDAATEQARLRFDYLAAASLHRRMQIAPGEASKGGVWEFMTCVLLCDLVQWRWLSEAAPTSTTSLDRWVAGRRNTFHRLWWRALFLLEEGGADPYALLGKLGEDEVVQIMERPNLAGNRRLSRTVARELVAASLRHPAIARRTLIRETQKRLRRVAAFTSLDSIEDVYLEGMVRGIFDEVAAAVSGFESV